MSSTMFEAPPIFWSEFITIDGGQGQLLSIPVTGAPAVQQLVADDISSQIENPNLSNPVSLSLVSLSGSGVPNTLVGTPSGGGNAYLYLSGSVTGGASISIPPGYLGVIANFSGPETLVGGAGNNTFLVTDSYSFVTYDPRGGTGSDSIFAGGSYSSLTLDGADYMVVANAGYNTITAAANVATGYSHNAITTGGGNNLIDLFAGSTSLQSEDGDTVNVAGSGNQITIGGGSTITLTTTSSGNSILTTGVAQINDSGTGNYVTVSSSGMGLFGIEPGVGLYGSRNIYSVPGAGKIYVLGNSNTVNSAYNAEFGLYGAGNTFDLSGVETLSAVVGSSANTINAGGSSVVLLGGSGNQISATYDNVVFASGQNNSVSASNNTLLVAGDTTSGTSDVVTLGGHSAIYAEGNTSVSATGSNQVVLQQGSNIATVGSSAVVFDDGGSNTVQASGSGSVFRNGGATDQLDFIGGNSGLSYVGFGGGAVTVTGDAGDIEASGGSAGNNMLTGGSGNATFYGSGSGDLLTAGTGAHSLLHAGGGNETLNAGPSAGTVTLEASVRTGNTAVMLGGSGSNDFVGGVGSSTMSGASNALLNNLLFGPNGGGTNLITGFRPGTDTLSFTAGQTMTQSTPVNGGYFIQLSDGTKITLVGVSALPSL